MKFRPTKIKDLYIIEPEPQTDARGYFARIFCKEELAKVGLDFHVAQINRSLTQRKGTVRGLHFQKEPRAEAKIVQCVKGAIYDVAVDVRKNSPTFGQWAAVELSAENGQLLYIPKGLAHGFETLADNCLVEYVMSEYYSPEHASGLRWNDPALGISWPIPNPIVSEKDSTWPFLSV